MPEKGFLSAARRKVKEHGIASPFRTRVCNALCMGGVMAFPLEARTAVCLQME